LNAPALPPLSLYVHLPWCVRKCPYCDFNSYRAPSELPERLYVDALQRDLCLESTYGTGRAVATIFIGGGTPSLFSGAAIAQLLRRIREHIDVVDGAEITLEANPGAVDARRFAAFRDAGVNRLSIGVQSFRTDMLRRLGRIHDGAEAVAAVEAAHQVGFDNVNLDLMYALPGDDARRSHDDLARAIALSPAHLSWYQLTLEPNTAFHRHPPELPNDEVVAQIETAGRELLEAEGFVRYEISAYARAGRRCAHNLNYWTFGDYLGIGAGAHGKVTMPDGTVLRRTKTRNPRTYLELAGQASAVVTERIETTSQLILEYLMNGLRLIEGVRIEEFEARTRQPGSALASFRSEAQRRRWMIGDPTRLAVTERGLQHLNSVLMLL
jgi:putative oxygen-independent coproporphyrinogen III oxidase